MIVGLGIDAVEIQRFEQWHNYDIKRLQNVFSLDEIEYALSVTSKSAERFAARFAAKEAAYKALAVHMAQQITFLDFCKLVAVALDANGAPRLVVDLVAAKISLDLQLLVSISHTKTLAMAVVVAEAR